MMSSVILLGVVISFLEPFASSCRVAVWAPVTRTPTLAAVFLVTVVHAVEDVVAAPAPRDAVRSVQTEELVLPALLHAADLAGQGAAGVRASQPSPRRHRNVLGCLSG